jgi:hypothetical protein
MTVPTVTELPMTLSAIEHDPFVDALETTTVASAEADAAKQTPPGRKSTRRRENVQTHMKKEHGA